MTLLLTEQEIRSVIDIGESIKVIESAFKAYGEGRVNMPPKAYLSLSNGDFRAMYGEIKGIDRGIDICGMKWVNVHPKNPKQGLPTVMAKILLNDPTNALELADMEGTLITQLRTGAAGAVAAKYLSRANSQTAAFIGSGEQAKTQLEGLLKVRSIKKVRVYDIDESKAAIFCEEMVKTHNIEVTPTDTVTDAVKNADILTTVTPSRKPLVFLEDVSEGTHINAIGADAAGKEELDPLILKKSRIIIDDWEQASHSGEINVPLQKGIISKKDVYANLGEVVLGEKGRINDKEITVFDSTGLIIQDLALAYHVYKTCKEKGLGQEKKFFTFNPVNKSI